MIIDDELMNKTNINPEERSHGNCNENKLIDEILTDICKTQSWDNCKAVSKLWEPLQLAYTSHYELIFQYFSPSIIVSRTFA